MPSANHRMHGRGRIGPGGLPWGTDPRTADVVYSGEELDWLKAIDQYKRRSNRKALTAPDVLRVALKLGYRQIAPPGPLPTYTPADE